ncbi:probable 2-oxoglutarate-dependent dioxygenase AOP1 [Tanacetum coccineum]
MHKLPTIDFTNKKNIKPGSTSWLATALEATRALEEYGCFIAEFNKVTPELNDAVFHGLEDLFDIPVEIKVQNKSTKPLYGYVGQIPFIPLYESMGFDYSYTLDGVRSFIEVMWPNGNEAFSANVLAYNKLVAELEEMVTRMVFETYGVEKYLDAHRKMVTYLCRGMKYRPPVENETNMGFVPHTDKDFITVLHQNGVNGLEVKARDGEWFRVEFEPSSYIVMSGDAAMAWSNERLFSPFHRVTMNGKESRYSIAQFSFLEGIIETPKEFVDEEHPLLFKPFDHLKYLDFYNKEENRRLECAIRTYCGV